MPIDFYLSGGTSPGAIRTFQGASNKTAGNCFTEPAQSADIFTSGNTLAFTYFVRQNAANCEVPDTPGPGSASGNYTISNITKNIPEYDCSEYDGLLEDPPTEDGLDTVRQEIIVLQGQLDASPDNDSLMSELLANFVEKEAILTALLETKRDAGDYQRMDNLLSGENTDAAERMRFGLKMELGQYAEAQTMLNGLPYSTEYDIWFKDVQQINLQWRQGEENFALSQQQEDFLGTVAHSNSPVRAYARSLLSMLKGERFGHEVPDLEGIIERSSGKALQAENVGELSVRPNPAANEFRVDFGRTTAPGARLRLMDIQGQTVIEKTVGETENTTLEVSNIPEGVYIMVLTENGRIDQQAKVVISK